MLRCKTVKTVFIILVLSLLTSLAGCYDLTEIENTLTVIAIGIDLNDNETTVTFATADISDKDKGAKAPLKCNTVNAESITDAAVLVEKKTSSHLSFTHIECIAANTNISSKFKSFIDEMYLKLNINSSADVVFTAGSAAQYLDQINKICESSPDMYFTNIFKSNKYLPSTSLANAYSSVMSGRAFISPLADITDNEYIYKAAIYKNSSIFILSDSNLLDAYCILTGKLNKITVMYNNGYYDVYISSKPKIKITNTDKSNIKILTTVKIRCENQTDEFVKKAKTSVCDMINNYYTFEQKSHIDMTNIEQHLKSSYLIQKKWSKTDWYTLYSNAKIVTEAVV